MAAPGVNLNSKIINNHIHDTTSNGMQYRGDSMTVEGNILEDIVGRGMALNNALENSSVSYNFFRRINDYALSTVTNQDNLRNKINGNLMEDWSLTRASPFIGFVLSRCIDCEVNGNIDNKAFTIGHRSIRLTNCSKVLVLDNKVLNLIDTSGTVDRVLIGNTGRETVNDPVVITASAATGNSTIITGMEFGRTYEIRVTESTALDGDPTTFRLGLAADGDEFLADTAVTGSTVVGVVVSGTENIGANVVLTWANTGGSAGAFTVTVVVK
jgi:hypothetical protein